MKYIKENAVLWINGFKEIPNDNPNTTELDLIKEENFKTIDNYNLENKKIYIIGERTFISCIWRKLDIQCDNLDNYLLKT